MMLVEVSTFFIVKYLKYSLVQILQWVQLQSVETTSQTDFTDIVHYFYGDILFLWL